MTGLARVYAADKHLGRACPYTCLSLHPRVIPPGVLLKAYSNQENETDMDVAIQIFTLISRYTAKKLNDSRPQSRCH
jgi:hypothetical protein